MTLDYLGGMTVTMGVITRERKRQEELEKKVRVHSGDAEIRRHHSVGFGRAAATGACRSCRR